MNLLNCLFLFLSISMINLYVYAESSVPILDNNDESVFKPYSREVENTFHIKLKERNDLPDDIKPKDYGHFWSVLPRDTATQKIINTPYINPTPTTISRTSMETRLPIGNSRNSKILK